MPKTNRCIYYLVTTTKWFPVLVTCTIFTWGWYAYNLQLILLGMSSPVQQILCSLMFQFLFVFSAWSYVQTIFKPTGQIPSKFYLSPEIIEDLTNAPSEQFRDEILASVVKKNDLPVSCRTYSGGIRYCEKCNLIKPDRCHHCSICGACILKMDHHCPWINNCVSFANYKFFVLFLGYTFAMCLFVAATSFPYFLKLWIPVERHTNNSNNATDNFLPQPGGQQADIISQYNPDSQDSVPFYFRFNILFLFFVSLMLSLGLVFLFCYHVYLLINNRSTLEAFRPPLMTYGPDRNAFNLGVKENLNQLFGRSKLLWFVPVSTTEGSGITYDQRRQLNQVDEEVRQELLTHHNNYNNNHNSNSNSNVAGNTSNQDSQNLPSVTNTEV